MKAKISAAEVSARLAGNMLGLVTYLLPGGRQQGAAWHVGGVNGESGKSLSVHLSGTYAGNWCDWNGQEQKGDALDLWCAVKGVSLPQAITEAKGWLGIVEEAPAKSYTRPQDDKPALSADGRAMHWMVDERKLLPEIVNRYRVQGDSEKRAIVFPSYSPNGVLLNRSYRALALDEKGRKKVWQDKDAAPSLWGWQSLTPENYKAREILICEGQIDAMTWAQWGIPALSIPNGSGQTWIDFEWDNLEPFKTIYLSFDNDGKTEAALATAISRLGKHRVRVVKFPHKDANDALKQHVTAYDARRWLESSEYPTVAHLFDAGHFSEACAREFFRTEEMLGHTIPQTVHHRDCALSFHFRPGELTVWTGTSGHGKSSVVNYAMIHLAMQTQRPSLIISLEMTPAKVLRRIIIAIGARVANEGDAKKMAQAMAKHLLFCDKTGGISRDVLFEMINYAHARYGIAHLVIDSLMRVEGLEEDYPAQNKFVTDLAEYSRATGVHVHLIAHPRKSPGADAPQGHDIKGSGHIRDNADNVLVVWRNIEMERAAEEGKSTAGMIPAKIIVEKDREEGTFREFFLEFNTALLCYVKKK